MITSRIKKNNNKIRVSIFDYVMLFNNIVISYSDYVSDSYIPLWMYMWLPLAAMLFCHTFLFESTQTDRNFVGP